MRKTDVQPLVPLEDLYQPQHVATAGVSMLPPDVEDYLARTYGVSVHRDHRFRLAVTLEDAYVIRDVRQAEAERLHAEWIANQRDAETVTAWQRARNHFWAINWIHVARQTPLGDGPERHVGEARRRLAEMVLAAEAAAGIPSGVQSRLSWPSHLSWTELENGSDLSYVPPVIDEEK